MIETKDEDIFKYVCLWYNVRNNIFDSGWLSIGKIEQHLGLFHALHTVENTKQPELRENR